MDHRSFQAYQKTIIARYQTILAQHAPGTFDEQALPAYTNPNPLMRWLFWQRVRTVFDRLDALGSMQVALDFGCGLGTMIPYLLERSSSVIAIDLDTSLLERIAANEGWQGLHFGTQLHPFLPEYQQQVDLILALDVLEHVNDLDAILATFKRLLKPGGQLIVSGPTENRWYALGRKLAGYSGDYHTRNIYDILAAMRAQYRVRVFKTLVPVVPLFQIAEAQPA